MKRQLVACLGFSSCLLIGLFTVWGGLPLTLLTGFAIPDILKFWSTPLLFALGLALFAVFFWKNPPKKRAFGMFSLLSGVLLIGGFIILFVLGTTSQSSTPAMIFSATSIGLGYGILLLLWQHQLSQFSDNEVIKILLLALIVSSASYLVLLSFLQDILAIIISSAFVVLSVACAHLVMPPKEKPESSMPSCDKASFKRIMLDLRDPLFCVSAIAVAVALTRFIALGDIENASAVNITASAGIIAVAIVLYIIWLGFKKDHPVFGQQNILWLYRVLFPAIATALVLLSIFGQPLAVAVTTMVYIAFALVSAFITSTSITIACKYSVWSPHIYGMFAGCMYFVFMVATLLGPLVYYPQNFGTATLPIIVLLVLYILAMSYFAIQKRRKGAEEPKDERAALAQETTVVDEVAQGCAILSERHGLTAREKDILLLIARGRDVPSIAKQLFISENTVRSHSKSVYKKLDIHSKQELLDVLETLFVEGA